MHGVSTRWWYLRPLACRVDGGVQLEAYKQKDSQTGDEL
jgi:hypothetical protein